MNATESGHSTLSNLLFEFGIGRFSFRGRHFVKYRNCRKFSMSILEGFYLLSMKQTKILQNQRNVESFGSCWEKESGGMERSREVMSVDLEW